jgi:uncharacterized membrane protein
MGRILKHLSFTRWHVLRAFPKAAMKAIEAAVSASETSHDGELRFVVEGGLDLPHLLRGITARQRAMQIFSRLRVWDTKDASGVLIYVQMADRRVEILADRGINGRVGEPTWQRICKNMEDAFRAGRFQDGAVRGVEEVGKVLAEHFPPKDDQHSNELPDAPVIL